MGTSVRTKVIGAIGGAILFVIGLVWLVVSGPKPFGDLLVVAGMVLAGSMLISWWIYRPGKSD